MNKLQQIEFEMLKEFIRICTELNLTYYLVCGSALGAAKYGGFVPWDDDMDVALPREHYNIFCENAQAMLPKHLFLQNSTTDKYFPLIFSKIRNSNTTYVEKPYVCTDINQGVYIDVFPLDGYPKEIKEQKKLEKEKRRYAFMRLCCIKVPLTWKTRLLVSVEKMFGAHKHPSKFVKRLNKYIAKYNTGDSDLWCNHGNWQGKLEYANCAQYGHGKIAVFEGMRVRIPQKIDEYLSQKYGDWLSDIPDDEKVGHHYYEIIDLEKPYTEYRHVLANGAVVYGDITPKKKLD